MKKKVVVCIDDDAGVLEGYEVLLGDHCRVFTASSPSAGLDLVARHRPDLVITDLLMPEMRGDDLAIRVRQTLPEARLIVVSASPPEQHHERFRRLRELGVDWVLPKPFDALRFLLVVSKLLGLPLIETGRPVSEPLSPPVGPGPISGPAVAPGSPA